MAVIVDHKNESIDSVLRRFQRQVVKEGIIADVLDKRFFVSQSEVKRTKKREFVRSAKRRRARQNHKPKVYPTLRKKIV